MRGGKCELRGIVRTSSGNNNDNSSSTNCSFPEPRRLPCLPCQRAKSPSIASSSKVNQKRSSAVSWPLLNSGGNVWHFVGTSQSAPAQRRLCGPSLLFVFSICMVWSGPWMHLLYTMYSQSICMHTIGNPAAPFPPFPRKRPRAETLFHVYKVNGTCLRVVLHSTTTCFLLLVPSSPTRYVNKSTVDGHKGGPQVVEPITHHSTVTQDLAGDPLCRFL